MPKQIEKVYIFSLALDYDPIATSEEEAREQAIEMIEQGDYSLELVETEKVE